MGSNVTEHWRRLDVIEALTKAWAAQAGGAVPAGTGVTWWPLDYINAALTASAEPWRVRIDDDSELSIVTAIS